MVELMRLKDLKTGNVRWALPLDFKSYDKTFGCDVITSLLDYLIYTIK